MRWCYFALLGLLVLLATSCVPVPTVPEPGSGSVTAGGMWVVCEGLWRQSNATLSYLQPGGAVIRDAMTYVNGRGLGDTPTDALVVGDTLVIAVNTSRTIVFVQKSTGKLLGTSALSSNREPYRLAVSGSRMWCTNLNDDSMTELQLNTMQVTVPSVHIGPAPEGIAVADGKIYVACSGLGDLRAQESGAGTLMIVRERDLMTLDTIEGLPNAGDVIADRSRHAIWCAYRNLPSRSDEVGGVALVDSRADTIVRRWELKSPMQLALDSTSGFVYVLHANGVDVIDPARSTTTQVLSHTNTTNSDMWYSLFVDTRQQRLYVGNARNYLIDGELLVFTLGGEQVGTYPVGPNPTSIVP